MKERDDQLRRKTRGRRTTVTKCVEAEGGFFEHVL